MPDEQDADGSWPMWAHDRKGEYQNIGEKWWVELHGLPDPVVPVSVAEVADNAPDATHWGWIWADHGTGRPEMIWAFRGAFDAQFPYGPDAEVEAGEGRVVRLRITERETA